MIMSASGWLGRFHLGAVIASLSAATITRLTKDWQDEATTFSKRSLAGTGYVY
jgi:hypothetical protein